MQIEEIQRERERYIELLLLADPSPRLILDYLQRGKLFVLSEKDDPIGVIHLEPRSENVIEIKNVAVKEDFQGKGYGKQLLLHAIKYCSQHGYKKILVGTGNSSFDNMAIYQKVGFRFASIVRDFFIEHYDEPIFENGIQCRDMLLLEMDLL